MPDLKVLLSPLPLFFLIVIAGLAIGKIRIYHVSLGIAGILFAAIFAGFLMNRWISGAHIQILQSVQGTMNTLSKLGSSLFVSVIGLQTGFSVRNRSGESLASLGVGAAMSTAGVLLERLISALDPTIREPMLLGVLCGALTSTPGLSSVCELIDGQSGEAVWGYGCSYFCGVLFAVIFARALGGRQAGEQPKKKTPATESKIHPEWILVSLPALLGGILGETRVPILNFSLGSTTCTLLAGLVVGCVADRKQNAPRYSRQVLNVFRNIGLAFFFAGTGYTTGTQAVNIWGKAVIYGASITLTAILCGILLCRLAASRFRLRPGFVIAGGMTSSPAYGAIGTGDDEACVNHFSFAYFGAMLALMVAIQIIGR